MASTRAFQHCRAPRRHRVNGTTTLSRTERPNGYMVTATSGEGLVSGYTTDTPTIGGLERTITAPDGTQTKITEKPAGETVTTSADGMLTTTLKAPDPRLGILAPYTQSASVKTPAASLSPPARVGRNSVLAHSAAWGDERRLTFGNIDCFPNPAVAGFSVTAAWRFMNR